MLRKFFEWLFGPETYIIKKNEPLKELKKKECELNSFYG